MLQIVIKDFLRSFISPTRWIMMIYSVGKDTNPEANGSHGKLVWLPWVALWRCRSPQAGALGLHLSEVMLQIQLDVMHAQKLLNVASFVTEN